MSNALGIKGIQGENREEDGDLSPIREKDDETEKLNKKLAMSREDFRKQ